MPEIAEVRTVANTLKKQVLDKEIKDVKVIYKGILECSEEYFKKCLIGNKFKDIQTKGKWLVFYLDDYCLLSHLRMEGKYFIKPCDEEIVKHEHIIIRFEDFDLRYHDVRKFGKMNIVPIEEVDTVECLAKLGPEPFDEELTKEYLFEKIHNKQKAIKTLLLDQTIVNGLGNIYANEVLYEAGVDPSRLGSNIRLHECQRIIDASKEIVKKAIEMGGTTIKSYTSSLGVIGQYQNYLKVHKKDKGICPKCENPIIKIKLNGRSTYYCPKCQK